jgi:hypothetical protein
MGYGMLGDRCRPHGPMEAAPEELIRDVMPPALAGTGVAGRLPRWKQPLPGELAAGGGILAFEGVGKEDRPEPVLHVDGMLVANRYTF